VQSSKRAGVKPLAQRDRDRNFHSQFVTQPGSPIQSLSDLKGRSFAFGDVNSTSGHLMPEYFMRENKVDPEVIAKAIYTGGHDATLLAVANGKVDAGALDEAVFQRMTSQGKVDPAKVRVFWTTPPFFDYVWVARKGLDGRWRTRSGMRSSRSIPPIRSRSRFSSRSPPASTSLPTTAITTGCGRPRAGRTAEMSFDLQGVRVVYPGRAGPVQALDGVTLRIATGSAWRCSDPPARASPLSSGCSTPRCARPRGPANPRARFRLAARARSPPDPPRDRDHLPAPSLVPPLSALQNALCGRIASWSLLRSVRALVAPPPDEVQLGKSALATVGWWSGPARARTSSPGPATAGRHRAGAGAGSQVVLADEPFASLDPGLTVQLADLLGRVCEKRTLVAMLHDVQLAVERFPRIVGCAPGGSSSTCLRAR